MRTALHPTRNEMISFSQYEKDFGHSPLLGDINSERARCPFCKRNFYTVAGKTGKDIGHFSHFPRSGYCPSKETSGHPYFRLQQVPDNPEQSRHLKAEFFARWEQYFVKIDKMVPFLSVEEFLGLIREANRLRIWNYHHLTTWELPYVFVLMNDFPPANSRKRDGKPSRIFWFRFWYDASVNTVDDLWIDRHEPPELFRASLHSPVRSGRIPGFKDINKYCTIERERHYLTQTLDHPFLERVRQKIEERLPEILNI